MQSVTDGMFNIKQKTTFFFYPCTEEVYARFNLPDRCYCGLGGAGGVVDAAGCAATPPVSVSPPTSEHHSSADSSSVNDSDHAPAL